MPFERKRLKNRLKNRSIFWPTTGRSWLAVQDPLKQRTDSRPRPIASRAGRAGPGTSSRPAAKEGFRSKEWPVQPTEPADWRNCHLPVYLDKVQPRPLTEELQSTSAEQEENFVAPPRPRFIVQGIRPSPPSDASADAQRDCRPSAVCGNRSVERKQSEKGCARASADLRIDEVGGGGGGEGAAAAAAAKRSGDRRASLGGPSGRVGGEGDAEMIGRELADREEPGRNGVVNMDD
ncbi:hypothetical protein AXG93_1838s1120 [Marchantia polymorpha subsp. ruderalis]|uniref:Uncharacterized protein n=1 Tax=Marchantia polymorpha subsp. ruderalis TaxID=1480154 RepID=A0A176WHJ4_MARPO|nr:hypothetical protein AXG93_1838s1120 [Marchantia polymorpha subsp. ruderalis]